MELAELTAYAEERYGIREQPAPELPGATVLIEPLTGKRIALLMRQWDSERGMLIERCDLRCGDRDCREPFLSAPLRMKGPGWVCMAFDETTDRETVFRLFDRAVCPETRGGFTIVLDDAAPPAETAYRETVLPSPGGDRQRKTETVPEKLREMRRRFRDGKPGETAAGLFYRQAVFMEDYEDDYPWSGTLICYYPTYRDLTTGQLRGYFSWRTRVRRGEYLPIPGSAAYLYLYELLNGIGAASPEEVLRKLKDFETGFLDPGIGDERMRRNLRRWMLDYAVIHGLPPELARQTADPELIEGDAALSILRSPEQHTDGAVFEALCRFGGKKTAESPVLKSDPERGRSLLSQTWRAASAYRRQGKDLFTLCFGERTTRAWYPLDNAVVFQKTRRGDLDYELDACRSYRCRDGLWQTESYERASFDRELLRGFLHEADARLRRFLKTGRYLREDPAYAWAVPYADAVIEEDRRRMREAARPKITIDLTDLDRIRTDADTTRESLLTGEEAREAEASAESAAEPVPAVTPAEKAPAESAAETGAAELPLDGVLLRVLRAVLAGEDAAGILREEHLLPSIAADRINEALYDVFGDTVLLSEEDRLSPAEDYREELERMLGGCSDG